MTVCPLCDKEVPSESLAKHKAAHDYPRNSVTVVLPLNESALYEEGAEGKEARSLYPSFSLAQLREQGLASLQGLFPQLLLRANPDVEDMLNKKKLADGERFWALIQDIEKRYLKDESEEVTTEFNEMLVNAKYFYEEDSSTDPSDAASSELEGEATNLTALEGEDEGEESSTEEWEEGEDSSTGEWEEITPPFTLESPRRDPGPSQDENDLANQASKKRRIVPSVEVVSTPETSKIEEIQEILDEPSSSIVSSPITFFEN
ncbi:MAG: hypothetical protein DDT31_01666 [Syntrophomonadaceae bacterium]|nr:hypothetical protein [Bacillota bacterium]